MIEYTVSPERSTFVSGEDVGLRVEIVNKGGEPVEVPDPSMRANTQPVHYLEVPGRPGVVRFTNCRVLSETPETESAAQKLIKLDQWQSWLGAIPLSDITDVTAHGEYRLRSSIAWQEVKAESKEERFRVVPLEPASIHLGLGARPLETGEGELAFIQRSEGAAQLYSFGFREVRPAIGEAKLDQAIHRLKVGANATDVGVPWRNAPFYNELIRWIVWREGRFIMGLSNTATEPVTFESPMEIGLMVRPPLKMTGAPVEVLALSKDHGELALMTLPPGSLAWRVKLPARADSIAALLGMDKMGSTRYVAFTAKNSGGFEIYLSRYRGTGSLEPFRHVAVPGPIPLENADPAVFENADGGVLVGVLALTGEHHTTAAMVEAVFAAGSNPGADVQVVPMGTLAEHPAEGALLYAGKDGVLERRQAVIALPGDRLLHRNEPGHLVPVPVPGHPTTPILLAPGKNTTYIIYFDRARGFGIEHL